MSSSLDYLELCRLCLVKDRVSVPIFEDEGDVRQIFLKITACLPVKVSREDKLPKKICDDCVYKVELFYQFWNTTANAEKQLLQWLGEVGGLEDKQGYVTEVLDTNVMKQERSSDSRLDGSVMQVGGHQNSMDMGMMDIITMPAGSEQQFTSVPMDTSGTVQTVQVVPGPSTQTTHDQMAQSQTTHLGEESEEENSDDGCDNEEGLPVKEEHEDDQGDQPLETTTFVALPCDEAGPSGLQQQKISEISEMSMQQTADNDPKTGKFRLPIIRPMGGKHLVFQKKLVKISKPLMGKLLSVATPMVQVKIEPRESPNPGDFEEVTIDGTSSYDIVAPKKKHDFIVYMCKTCKMYFPVRQMLENHNAKVHAPQKSPAVVVSRVVVNKTVQQTETIASPPKKRQKRLQPLVQKPKESPVEGEDRIYFTGYYKLSSGDYVCSSCNFSSRIRTTVASHAARKHNSTGLESEEKSTLFKDLTEEESNIKQVEEDDEGSWPVEVVEEEIEVESEKDPLTDNPGRSCPHCPFVSSIGSTYHSHIKRKHREQWLKSVANRVAALASSSVTNTLSNQLSCAFCPFKSFKRTTMRSHVVRKHQSTDPLKDDPELADMQAQTEGKKVRKCPYCPFESWVYSTMNSHITRNHGDQPHPLFSKNKPRYNMQLFTGYACHYCSFAGATVMSIRSHTAREHTGRKQPLQQVPVKEFDCDQCDYKTKSRRNMQQHLKDCHTMLANTDGMFQCHACSYETQSRMGLQRHVSIKHSVLASKNIADSAYFKCEQCDYKTLNTKLLDWHKRQHSEENDGENDGKCYECNECDFSTWAKSQLYQHIRRKHKDGEGNEKEQEPEVEQLFACGQCDYVSKNKHAMKTHVLRKHTDDYPHECSLCEKKYKVKADLTNHIRFQHREQPIICDVCGKTCRNSNLLYLHQKFAHYKPDFECHICHRRMVSQANLDDHILKQHEQVEESVCEECGKTFRKAARLKIHMRVHTGVKPYTCKICMKSFARRNGLRQHLLIHTGKRPYICDICGKSFTQKTGLICHRKMHPGDKPPLPRVTIEHVLTDLL